MKQQTLAINASKHPTNEDKKKSKIPQMVMINPNPTSTLKYTTKSQQQ